MPGAIDFVMNKTRISILHYAAPPIIGGVESTIYHHARLLSKAGYSVQVVAGRGAEFSPDVGFTLIPEVDSNHPTVLQTGNALAQGQVTSEFDELRNQLAESLQAAMQDSSVLIVHNAHTLHKNLALTAALHQLHSQGWLPMIAWSHDFAWQDPLYTSSLHPGYPWDLLRQAWPGVYYVAVSQDRAASLAELLGVAQNAIQVITPGIDPVSSWGLDEPVQSLVERLSLLEADPLLLLPARLTRRKNIELAVRVTAALQAYLPRPTLLVTGPPGPHNPKNLAYLEQLQNLRAELGMQARVIFLAELGPDGSPLLLNDASLPGLFRLADALLFPSHREGFGIPVLEAGLARLPVFAADIPPVAESSGGLAQVFSPQGEPQAIAQMIASSLSEDRAYQLKRRVIDQFSWDVILHKKIIPLLKEVL
jgi:glycosyltransferase involved in cell wall biosynthesis